MTAELRAESVKKKKNPTNPKTTPQNLQIHKPPQISFTLL